MQQRRLSIFKDQEAEKPILHLPGRPLQTIALWPFDAALYPHHHAPSHPRKRSWEGMCACQEQWEPTASQWGGTSLAAVALPLSRAAQPSMIINTFYYVSFTASYWNGTQSKKLYFFNCKILLWAMIKSFSSIVESCRALFSSLMLLVTKASFISRPHAEIVTRKENLLNHYNLKLHLQSIVIIYLI